LGCKRREWERSHLADISPLIALCPNLQILEIIRITSQRPRDIAPITTPAVNRIRHIRWSQRTTPSGKGDLLRDLIRPNPFLEVLIMDVEEKWRHPDFIADCSFGNLHTLQLMGDDFQVTDGLIDIELPALRRMKIGARFEVMNSSYPFLNKCATNLTSLDLGATTGPDLPSVVHHLFQRCAALEDLTLPTYAFERGGVPFSHPSVSRIRLRFCWDLSDTDEAWVADVEEETDAFITFFEIALTSILAGYNARLRCIRLVNFNVDELAGPEWRPSHLETLARWIKNCADANIRLEAGDGRLLRIADCVVR
jgi:hypothetical protein